MCPSEIETARDAPGQRDYCTDDTDTHAIIPLGCLCETDWIHACQRERERERWHMNVHCVYVKRKIISGKSPSLVHSSAACWTKSKSQKLVCRNFGPGCHSVSCQPCWPPSAGSVQPAVESKVKSSK